MQERTTRGGARQQSTRSKSPSPTLSDSKLRERMFQLGEREVEIEKIGGRAASLIAARGFQRLRRVNIQKRAVALDRDFSHRFVMLGNQMTRADIAIERHQLVEEAARPQHRIAAPAVADGNHNQIAPVRRKALDKR